MQLKVTTENAQDGDASVETVKIFDGEILLVTVKKIGDEIPEIKVVEAFKPGMVGGVVEIVAGEKPVIVSEEIMKLEPKSRKLKVGD
jgi:hypothetical protein